jgi:lauroyl/myristoyl acyltransferase
MELSMLNLLDRIVSLPLQIRYRITDFFAILAYLLFSGKRNIVRKNISIIRKSAASEKDVREVFRYYGRYWAELPVVEQVWKNECKIICGPDFPPLEPCFLGVTFHIGNFELFGPALFECTGSELHVVAERLYPQSLFNRFFKIRKRHHIHTIANDDVRGIIDVLKRGNPLGVVCDRSVNRKGDGILLFGKRWIMPLSIIRYALTMKIPVYYSYCLSDEGILQLFCKKSAGVENSENVILEITEMLETALCRYPLQWHNISTGLEG